MRGAVRIVRAPREPHREQQEREPQQGEDVHRERLSHQERRAVVATASSGYRPKPGGPARPHGCQADVKKHSPPPDKVRRLLAQLPDNYRLILELRFLQAFSVRQAASQMGVSVANAKVLQYRALRMAAQTSGEETT